MHKRTIAQYVVQKRTMKNVILKLFLISALITSCKEEDESTVSKTDGNIIELVGLGLADNPTDTNKRFGITYYCYLNLENDSVYIQRKLDPLEDTRTVAWAGTVKGLAENDLIQGLIEFTGRMDNGRVKGTKPPTLSFHHSPDYVLLHKQANKEKFLFYSTYKLDKRIKEATQYMINLQYDKQLDHVPTMVNEDSIVLPIINKEGFDFLPPPPRPVKSTIEFKSPVEK
jgi:hypothetical protein